MVPKSEKFEAIFDNLSADAVCQILLAAGCKPPRKKLLMNFLHDTGECRNQGHSSRCTKRQPHKCCIVCGVASDPSSEREKSYFESEDEKLAALCHVLEIDVELEDVKSQKVPREFTNLCETCEIELSSIFILQKCVKYMEGQNSQLCARFRGLCSKESTIYSLKKAASPKRQQPIKKESRTANKKMNPQMDQDPHFTDQAPSTSAQSATATTTSVAGTVAPTRKSDRLKSAPYHYSCHMIMGFGSTKKNAKAVKVEDAKVKSDGNNNQPHREENQESEQQSTVTSHESEEANNARDATGEESNAQVSATETTTVKEEAEDDDEEVDEKIEDSSQKQTAIKLMNAEFKILSSNNYQCLTCKEEDGTNICLSLDLVPRHALAIHSGSFMCQGCGWKPGEEFYLKHRSMDIQQIVKSSPFLDCPRCTMTSGIFEIQKETVFEKEASGTIRRSKDKSEEHNLPKKRAKLEEYLFGTDEDIQGKVGFTRYYTLVHDGENDSAQSKNEIEDTKVASKIGRNKQSCPLCSKYMYGYLIKGHLKNNHNNPNRPYICAKCTQCFPTQDWLDRHTKMTHPALFKDHDLEKKSGDDDNDDANDEGQFGNQLDEEISN